MKFSNIYRLVNKNGLIKHFARIKKIALLSSECNYMYLQYLSLLFSGIFFQIWLLLYLMTFLKILSESSVPGAPVCNVSILIIYICTCTSIWFSIPDIQIHYENLFMIKKDWTVLYFVYSHHALQASFVMTDIVTKVVLTKLRLLLFHTNM